MELPKDRKMTFIEFVASEETCDGTIDETWLKHWTKHLPLMLQSEDHCGDCTNVPSPCSLCVVATLLKEYREYFFNEKELEDRKC